MYRGALIGIIAALAAFGRAAELPLQLPEVRLAISPPFRTSVTVRHFRAGEDILNSPPYRLTTAAPMTEYHGWFGPRAAKQDQIHGWTVQVYATVSKKVGYRFRGAKARLRDRSERGAGAS